MIVELTCTEAWREISEMIDDALAPEMRERLELHFSHCAHCRAVYDGARNIVGLVSDERFFEVPAGMSERLARRLASEAKAG